MDIKRKAFESSNNVNPDWSFKFDEELQQYVALDHEMQMQVDEFNEHWDTFCAGWDAKAQAVPDGFVLVPKEPTLLMQRAGSAEAIKPNLGIVSMRDIYKAMIEAAQEQKV